jgi:hypothetical protein
MVATKSAKINAMARTMGIPGSLGAITAVCSGTGQAKLA